MSEKKKKQERSKTSQSLQRARTVEDMPALGLDHAQRIARLPAPVRPISLPTFPSLLLTPLPTHTA